MNILRGAHFGLLVVAIAGAPYPTRAEVARIEIASRAQVLDGKAFGDVGAYEKIIGKVFFSVDPANPRNKPIVDLDKAPRDAAGQVEFSADLYVLTPKNAARGNGVAFFDVLNRGRKNILRDFNHAPQVLDPTAAADFGDGFLMRQGYTLVWVGWQFDIPRRGGLMALDAPPALDHGKPITGRVSSTFTPNTADPTHPLDDMGRYADTTAYPPLDPASPMNMLTVRDGFRGVPRTIARDQWQFGRMKDGQLVPDITALYLKDGYQPGHVYELSYEAKGAVVAGLAFAALRDMAAAVKHAQGGPVSARYAYAFGPSQDGRFLREFLYEGFNADEQDRRVFDGVIANIAGSGRGGDFNARFARPNGLGFFEASLFPFLDLDQHDPVTGKTDGLLMHLKPEQRPKIFYTNSSGEYWGGGRAAALTHTTLDGREDATEPDNVRIYLFAGTQHVPGGFLASQGEGQQKPNPNDYSWAHRALLVAMDHWVRDGRAPPASRHPRLADRTLVPRDRIEFPAIPGVHPPLGIPAGYRADLEGGPTAHPLPLLVPQVDGDGNELAGIQLPDVAVPLATYTGWNFRSPSIGQPTELLPLTGSYILLPVTKAAREAAQDPRFSIEERYGSRARYQALVTDRGSTLVREGYLLSADLGAVVDRALARWDDITKGTTLSAK
jgi:Alpha/beta hydrolase domain